MKIDLSLTIYNSLSGKKEKFTSNKKTVGIYVCGVTPYDITHLGHALTYVFFDVVVRFLEYLGYHVKYIQNVTDIDDDILKKAAQEKKNWRDLAEVNFANFLNDLRWLNVRQPDFFPRATDHIKEMISYNLTLLAKGYAYEKSGNLYFNIKRAKNYGRLSRLKESEMLPISRERGNNPADKNKINPLDFVLWQKKKKDEPACTGRPAWDSPWGKGRPGWHIECSVMAGKYLGETIDIHGGGGDLIFPHHESEIAQSEGVTGKKFSRFFMHTAMLYYQGKKMSKSLGNMVFVRDLQKNYSSNTVRLLLLSNHYRKKWQFTQKLLNQAKKNSQLFRNLWHKQSGYGRDFPIDDFKKEFFAALSDDFNTKKAIQILLNLTRQAFKEEKRDISKVKAFLNSAFNILGLEVEY